MIAEKIEEQLELEAALQSARYLLFKHSTICPVSAMAFHEYQIFVERHPDLASGWIDVRGQRSLSQWVAKETGIRHQSPQAILVEGGQVVWHADHWEITEEALGEALQRGD